MVSQPDKIFQKLQRFQSSKREELHLSKDEVEDLLSIVQELVDTNSRFLAASLDLNHNAQLGLGNRYVLIPRHFMERLDALLHSYLDDEP